MLGGVDVAPAASCRGDQGWWGTEWLTVQLHALFTRVAIGFAGETSKGFGGARERLRGGVFGCGMIRRVAVDSDGHSP